MDAEQEEINRAYERDKRIEQRLKQEHIQGEHKDLMTGCSLCFYSCSKEARS